MCLGPGILETWTQAPSRTSCVSFHMLLDYSDPRNNTPPRTGGRIEGLMTCTCRDILDSVLLSSPHSAVCFQEWMGQSPDPEGVVPVGESPAHLGLKNHEK